MGGCIRCPVFKQDAADARVYLRQRELIAASLSKKWGRWGSKEPILSSTDGHVASGAERT